MSSYLASMILPAWLHFAVSNFWVIATSAVAGYLIGKEGGLWPAMKRFSFIVVLATSLVAAGAFVKENLPDWAQDARQADLEKRNSGFNFWGDSK